MTPTPRLPLPARPPRALVAVASLAVAVSLLSSCAKKPPARAAAAAPADVMKPATRARQIVEGRLVYEEQQIVEGQDVRTTRRWVFALAGERAHVLEKDGLWLEDALTEMKLVESDGPAPGTPQAFSIRHPVGHAGTFRFRGAPEGAFSVLTEPLESVYRLGHFRFDGKLTAGRSVVQAVPLTRLVQGQVLDTTRDVRYELVAHTVSRNQNQAVVRGTYQNTAMGTLRTGAFDLECVGRADLELEFQVDTGVWTRVDVKEIIGWAGIAFDDAQLTPVNTGHRTVTHLQLHLTTN
jgi:hypothetical protein